MPANETEESIMGHLSTCETDVSPDTNNADDPIGDESDDVVDHLKNW